MNETDNENENDTELRAEVERLENDSRALREEIRSLRQFIDSMQNLMDAVENPLPDAEIMELLAQVLDNAMQTIDAKDGSLLVLDEDTDELVFVLSLGEVPHDKLAWRRVPPGEGVAGWVVHNRKATIVNDAQTDDRFYGKVDRELEFRTSSILAAPIIGGGSVLGVVEMLNKRDGKLFSVADQTLLTLMCRFSGELLFTVIRQAEERPKLAPGP